MGDYEKMKKDPNYCFVSKFTEEKNKEEENEGNEEKGENKEEKEGDIENASQDSKDSNVLEKSDKTSPNKIHWPSDKLLNRRIVKLLKYISLSGSEVTSYILIS